MKNKDFYESNNSPVILASKLSPAERSILKEKLMSFRPRYQIFVKDKLFAEVTKEISWFKQNAEEDILINLTHSCKGG
ncbi:hypothetical protein KAH27_05845 [bacterium]|nr:hypothetical protein [bacterium]